MAGASQAGHRGPACSGGPEQKAGIGAPELSRGGGSLALSESVGQMANTPDQDVTALLASWTEGDEDALNRLLPLVEQELRRLARRQMQGERPGHLLQATALVNEAYLKLVDIQRMRWQNRAHFFAVAARLMRRILVDAARSQQYQKRGGRAPARRTGRGAARLAGGARAAGRARRRAQGPRPASPSGRAGSWSCGISAASASRRPPKC